MDHGKVLVVEDDSYWQEVLRETLEEHRVTVVTTYEEARQALEDAQAKNQPFHVVTVDMELAEPVRSANQSTIGGHRIMGYVSRVHQHTRCVVVTGSDISNTDVRNFFKRYQVHDFVEKDRFDLQTFCEIISKAVAESRRSTSGQGVAGRRYVGRYEIMDQIGTGAMGIVYRARDPNIDRIVALKALRPELGADSTFRTFFHQEARSIGRLAHPNIVTIHDAAEQDGVAFIVEEYLEGVTLEQVLRQEAPLPIERIVDIGLQICSALEYAHQQGIVHRDIKPSNLILVQVQGREQVKITDFGIAKMMSATRHTQSGLFGTVDYMSPEQAQNKTVDQRADLYSLGVVLYEMLTGHVPFVADHAVSVILSHVQDPWPMPSNVSPALLAVLQRVSAKDPELRYQSASELAMALEASLEDAW